MQGNKCAAVCMLVTNIDAPTGGVQKNSRLLMREYGKRGIATYVCARNYYGLARSETVNGVTFHRSPVVGKSMAVNGLLYLIDTFSWLIRHRKKYDVIHCQQMFGPTMAAAAASFFVGKPVVARVTLSGNTGEVKAVRKLPLASLRMRLIRRVSRWVALTREMADEIETLGIARQKIDIINNSAEIPADAAFDLEAKARYRTVLKLNYEKIGIFAGRLSREKNLDVLIDAWKKISETHHDAHLLLLGEGGDFRNVEEELRLQAEKLGLDSHVHFLGHVTNAKDYFLASDVFILPTQAEGMSNALVEAFACGTAIVATDIAANREICEDGINSLLVPVGDANAIRGSVDDLFTDSGLHEKLSRAARIKAENELSTDRMVSAYVETYNNAIENSR